MASHHAIDRGQDAVDVLILSTYDSDGAGKFTSLIAETLKRLGHSVRIVCAQKRSGDRDTHGILDHRPLRKAAYRLVDEFDRRVFRLSPDYAFIHLRAIDDREVLASDVWPKACKLIICTFLDGMMNPSALVALQRRVGWPVVVFYGVDMNFYTAGCHYARECEGYLQTCSSCPAVSRIGRPAVAKAFLTKQDCYQRLGKYVVVASSHEHHQQIRRSFLFGNSDIRRMLMGVDETLFGGFEEHRSEIRDKYGFSGSKVLLLRSSSEPRKGVDMFAAAARSLESSHPDVLDSLTVVAIGDQYLKDRLRDCRVRLYSPGYIDSEQELARLYAAADVFLNTSLADGGPVMLAQALMSGTPVITTDVGLARDLMRPPGNGCILRKPSPLDVVDAIVEFCGKSEAERLEMRKHARVLALEQLGTAAYRNALGSLVGELFGAD